MRSIETIKAGLLDAEKKQDSSAAIKDWIKRVRDVLYEAEDLFDQVATDEMMKNRIKGNKLLKKVRAFASSSLNPIASNNSIAKKVKDIRKSLLEISEDMQLLRFEERQNETTTYYGMRKGNDTAYIGLKNVIGRDEDKRLVLEMLLCESNDPVSVIAIVGIGGMGKTTLAQLVFNHEEVKSFEYRWFACISDTLDDKEVFLRILQSIREGNYANSSVQALQCKLEDSIKGKKFLLILDDVWDDDPTKWMGRLSSLSSGSNGSKIVVTTRYSTVAKVVGAEHQTRSLDGLSEADSWNLFKHVAHFTPEHDRDPRWTNLGKEIVKKCANVPLSITCIAGLLFGKNTMSFRSEELPKLGEGHKDGIMPVLKWSYEHLPSNIKHCFAYCALFPKDHEFEEDELIWLWISQGYIKPYDGKHTFEEVGHSYFMNLIRWSFFQAQEPQFPGERRYKMHDLIHDLAQHVAGEESVMLAKSSGKIGNQRHVSAWGYSSTNASLDMQESSHNGSRLRSFIGGKSRNLEKQFQFADFKWLRALSVPVKTMDNVPSYIGELKHLRYLDLSDNKFKHLPDSITKLVNLCTLNISWCTELEALPNDLRKLINLRHLINKGCIKLMHMPPGFGELTSLQRLDDFKAGGVNCDQRSGVDALSSLELKERVLICFGDEQDDWDGVECWRPPLTLKELEVRGYKGIRIPRWSDSPSKLAPQLTSLSLKWCSRVKCLPPLRHIPNLNELDLYDMRELEYIQEEEEDNATQGPNAVFLPDLKKLTLVYLPKLKGWRRREVETTARGQDEDQEQPSSRLQLSFPSLSHLDMVYCGEFNPMLICPQLRFLNLVGENTKIIQRLLSTRDNNSSLVTIMIHSCDQLSSFPGEFLTSIRHLRLTYCNKLKQVRLAASHLSNLEGFVLLNCQELELWEEKKMGVAWDSLSNLRMLVVQPIPTPEMLPNCLRLRQELGKLKINDTWLINDTSNFAGKIPFMN